MQTKTSTHDKVEFSAPKEGELYKEVTIYGKTFRLLYGYYENFERENPFNEPVPIYPDFTKEPQYTAEGIPIVTAMQDICEFYTGKNEEDCSCFDCQFFQKSEELFGICNCPHKKQGSDQKTGMRNE